MGLGLSPGTDFHNCVMVPAKGQCPAGRCGQLGACSAVKKAEPWL